MSKLSSKQFEAQLAELAAESRRNIEAQVSGFPNDPKARTERVKRAMADFRYFCHTYFPHYVPADDNGVIHESLFQGSIYDDFPKIIDRKKGSKEVMAAPRGESKSTVVTQLGNLWIIVTGRKHFCVIMMDTFDQASMMLDAIKAELESNPRLKQDFPDATGPGRVWKNSVLLTKNNIKVQVAGSGKAVRGWRHGPHRPDFVVLDDIENDENVRQPAQRDKLEAIVNKSIAKLGPPDGSMDLWYVGTMLHYDSVLNRTMKKPTWNARKFKAIMTWPDRRDLWDKWEELLINHSEELADSFYKKNKKKMHQGAVVSWPGVRGLEALMKIRADDHHAFDCELQNEPTDSQNAPFKDLTFWVHVVNSWVFYGTCDPSLGKKNKNRDPAAILVGGMNRKTGVLDVVEADISRKLPTLIIARIIDFQRQYRCQIWGIESIAFQEFLRTEIVAQSAAQGVPVPAMPIIPNTDKDLRIESLQPHVFNALIRFNQAHVTLLDQMRHYPEADHDDGPDALHMLWELAVKGAGGIPKIYTK